MSDRTMFIVTSTDPLPASDGAQQERPFQQRRRQGLTERQTEIAVETVKKNMSRFLEDMAEVLDAGVEVKSTMVLKRVAVTAQVSAKGELSLLGSGASVQGSMGLKFTFERE